MPLLPPADVPISAELVDAMHRLDIVEVSLVAPSVLQEIVTSTSFLQNLRRLNAVIYGGGPLPRDAGEVIRSVTDLYSFMGSSEMYIAVTDVIDQEDWEYLHFNEMVGSKFRPHSEDLWELCLVRKPELDLYQGIFLTFPTLQEYHTNDLYSKHAIKPDLWRYSGRADDIITLTNGEKLNPVAMEYLIGKHPDVKAVLVAGQARFRTALLVEAKSPPLTASQRVKLRQKLWPIIAEAHKECPAHGKLSRDLILFTDPTKPFSRSQKGTIQRRLTFNLYERELNAIYDAANQPLELHLERPRMQDVGSLQKWLHLLINRITDWDVDSSVDLFSLGMDSLQVLKLIKEINATLFKGGTLVGKISANTIYSYPTVEKMTFEIGRILASQTLKKANAFSSRHNYEEKMQTLLSNALKGVPINSRRASKERSPDQMRIILTGSTGYIGSNIFNSLLANPKVCKIYCLNRSVNAEERQRAGQAAKSLCTEWSRNRVKFLTCTLPNENFGLQDQHYDDMLQSVTHIVHNAWAVDFNLSLDSFGDHVTGVLQLIRFSARSEFGASLNFLSSISAVLNWNTVDSGSIPEKIIGDWSAPEPFGYAQSKYVAERLLNSAATVAGIRCIVWRVGQIAGPGGETGGMWNKREWFPSLIASSLFLGKIPNSLGPNNKINWVPVDSLSQIIMDILGEAETTLQELHTELDVVNGTSQINPNSSVPSTIESPPVYNLVNPSTTSWQSLFPAIQAYYPKSPLETVTLREWVDALMVSISNDDSLDMLLANPAAKLLNFFQTLAEQVAEPEPSFETSHAARASKTLRDLRPVSPGWMVRWLEQWDF